MRDGSTGAHRVPALYPGINLNVNSRFSGLFSIQRAWKGRARRLQYDAENSGGKIHIEIEIWRRKLSVRNQHQLVGGSERVH